MDYLVQNISSILITATIIGVALWLRPLIETGVEYLKQRRCKEAALTVVRAIEQSPVTRNHDGADKKQLALLWLPQMTNLDLAYDEMDRLIEEAVQIISGEKDGTDD